MSQNALRERMIHVGASCRHEARSGGVERRVSGAAKELRMVRGQIERTSPIPARHPRRAGSLRQVLVVEARDHTKTLQERLLSFSPRQMALRRGAKSSQRAAQFDACSQIKAGGTWSLLKLMTLPARRVSKKDALHLDARRRRQCTMSVQRHRGHRPAAPLLDAGEFRGGGPHSGSAGNGFGGAATAGGPLQSVDTSSER